MLLVARRRDEDLQVLLHPRVGLRGQPCLEFGGDALEVRLQALVVAWAEVEDALVMAFDTERGGAFRAVLREDLEQRRGVGVAAFDPVRSFGGVGRSEGPEGGDEEESRQDLHVGAPGEVDESAGCYTSHAAVDAGCAEQ